MFPGGRCDTQKGLDCVGESHCFYGICVCLYGLVIVGHECANADVLKPVPPGGNCSLGQQCQGRARCVRGKCQCPRSLSNSPNQLFSLCFRGQRPDSESHRCIKSAAPLPQINKEPAHSEAEAPTASVIPLNVQQMPKFIYTIPAALAAAAEDGKFNQILTANQMSINLMDQQLLRSLLAPMVQPSRRSSDNAGTGCEGLVGGYLTLTFVVMTEPLAWLHPHQLWHQPQKHPPFSHNSSLQPRHNLPKVCPVICVHHSNNAMGVQFALVASAFVDRDSVQWKDSAKLQRSDWANPALSMFVSEIFHSGISFGF